MLLIIVSFESYVVENTLLCGVRKINKYSYSYSYSYSYLRENRFLPRFRRNAAEGGVAAGACAGAHLQDGPGRQILAHNRPPSGQGLRGRRQCQGYVSQVPMGVLPLQLSN